MRTRFCRRRALACARTHRTKTAAQPHVLTGMAGFSSGSSLMPRLIRQHRGRFPPDFIYRTDQRREGPRRKVVQQHRGKRAVVERKLDGDKTYVLW